MRHHEDKVIILTQNDFISSAKSYSLFSTSILWLAYAALTAFTSTANGMSIYKKSSKHYTKSVLFQANACNVVNSTTSV
jgi:hypothetical protein